MQQDPTTARAEELRCADCGEAFDDTQAYLRHRTERHGDEVHVNSRGVSSLEPAGTARAESLSEEHPSEQEAPPAGSAASTPGSEDGPAAGAEQREPGGGIPSGDAGMSGAPPNDTSRNA